MSENTNIALAHELPLLNELPFKQRRFLIEFAILGFKQQEIAYKNAGYKGKNTDSLASTMLSKPKVKEALQQLTDYVLGKGLRDAEDIVREMEKCAYTNIANYASWDADGKVTFVPSKDIPLDELAAVQGVKQGANGMELKLVDKQKAQQDLARINGLLREDTVPVKVELNIING